MKHTRGKMKFLAIKLSALKSELKISREIFITASREVDTKFKQKYFPEIPPESEESKETSISEREEQNSEESSEKVFTPEGEQQESEKEIKELLSSKKEISLEVKKLFRKISLEVHPDRLLGLEDGFEKERKTNLYEKARKALDDDDIIIMSDVAMELGLDVPEISTSRLKAAEKEISAIKKELSYIESTIVWHWFFTDDKEKKEKMLQNLFNLMYEEQKKQNSST